MIVTSENGVLRGEFSSSDTAIGSLFNCGDIPISTASELCHKCVIILRWRNRYQKVLKKHNRDKRL